ncbi:MAG: hypothetical protein JJ920_08560 [Roseitalea sp.]|jgi:hypothetical protein|nr:hypothetical protein [Roseitalea sp.]MBO6722507.1 hypothetical protein [Roseitalea sp.]MBO6742949.1 hypothetical protein [Roseitalea sp.]
MAFRCAVIVSAGQFRQAIAKRHAMARSSNRILTLRQIAGDDRMGRHVGSNDRARSDDGAVAAGIVMTGAVAHIDVGAGDETVAKGRMRVSGKPIGCGRVPAMPG